MRQDSYIRKKAMAAIIQAIERSKAEGIAMPVSDAYVKNANVFDKDIFFSVARSAGYNVNLRDGKWYEQTPN